MTTHNNVTIKAGFITKTFLIDINKIEPLKIMLKNYKYSQKYKQILRSVQAIGLVEPLVVFPDPKKPNFYLLLDGHSRLLALQSCDQAQVLCLIATEDDTYTYNKKVNRIASIQGVNMIIKAVNAGVSVEGLANALNLSPTTIKNKFNLLNGIDKEAIKIMADQDVSTGVFPILRKMKRLRQLDAVIGMKNKQDFSVSYARFLLDSSLDSDLLPSPKNKKNTTADLASIAQLNREISNLRIKQKNAYQTFSVDNFKFTAIKPFINKLLNDVEIVKWLATYENESLVGLNDLVNIDKL